MLLFKYFYESDNYYLEILMKYMFLMLYLYCSWVKCNGRVKILVKYINCFIVKLDIIVLMIEVKKSNKIIMKKLL